MELVEVADRLRTLAEAFHGDRMETTRDNGDRGYIVTRLELEAVTTAAAILGMFAEALEDTST